MARDLSVTLNLDLFDMADKAIEKGASEGLAALGFVLQEEIQNNIQLNQQVDTGAMRTSTHTVTDSKDNRQGAIEDAKRKAAIPGVKSGRTHDAPASIPGTEIVDPMTVKVAMAMEYAEAQEALNPFAAPAVATVTPKAEGLVGAYIVEALK